MPITPIAPMTPAEMKAHELITLNPRCAPPSKGRRKYLKRISTLIIAAYNDGHADALEATRDLTGDLQTLRIDIDRLTQQISEAQHLAKQLMGHPVQ